MKTNSPCRSCGTPLHRTFVDLGLSPLANAYLRPDQLRCMEPLYPLHVHVCDACLLVQLEEFESPSHIFSDYFYFSSFSQLWLDHAQSYAGRMCGELGLGAGSLVVEIASNDGYLLQYFKEQGVPVLGVEPAANVAKAAVEKGIPTDVAFFGQETARRLRARGVVPDLIAANNVLAHVPDLNDFVAGFKTLLAPAGTITVEFPHLMRLISELQFDTIYHEHFSYFSLLAVEKVFERHQLTIFDVEELPTHGGSLRLFVSHAGTRAVSPRVAALRETERAAGLHRPETYGSFAEAVVRTKCDILEFLINARRAGKRVAAYGAPAKGNTLLNYCGIGPELVAFTVDRSPHKQGHFLPGSHIPILAPSAIFERRPDCVLILPWNLKDEIAGQLAGIRDWGGQLVVTIPTVEVLS